MSLKASLRIMVVDDMSVSRALISQSLEEIGLKHVMTESDSPAAYSKLAVAPVHLVISDMNMPGLSGLDLLERLRSTPATQKIGFILITGTPTPEILKRGQSLGLNNLIRKPFTTDVVRAGIERVVGVLT